MSSTQTEYFASSAQSTSMQRLERLSRILDTVFPIPGTQWRIGIDSLLGFIPGVGDTLGAALSTYIIVEAARMGAPKRALLRMIGNVAVETIVGAIPLVGDIFDVAWKANVRNVALLHDYRNELGRTERSSQQIARLILVAAVVIIGGLAVLSLFLLRFLYQLITT